MKTVEEQYEEYKNAPDKTIVINGVQYFKAVSTEQLTLHGEPVYSLVLPYSMFDRKGNKNRIVDQHGHIFDLAGPTHIHFIGEIPQWYFECGSFLIRDFDCSETEIGEYFAVISEQK